MEPGGYIFVRDDGTAFRVAEPPTPEDLDHAKYGLLTILRPADLHYYGRGGGWRKLPEGKLVTPDMEGTPSEPFHVSANF